MKSEVINLKFKLRCQRLRKAIESSVGEREVHSELELNPWVVLRLFETGHNNGYIISHFSLGDDLRLIW